MNKHISLIPDTSDEDNLVLNIKGFEGPLELLLSLKKKKKVDLREISILELVDQYSNFIKKAASLLGPPSATTGARCLTPPRLRRKAGPISSSMAPEKLHGICISVSELFDCKQCGHHSIVQWM